MDMNKNRIPGDVCTIHFIAICGTGMGALACMLKDLGFEVTGSDQHVYPPMSRFLESKGIPIANGFNGKILAGRPDLVVVGNAVSRDNPEVEKMMEMGLHFCSMPQAINWFAAKGKKRVVITGTHGKTTTSSIVAWLLDQAGLDPSFIIGGILKDYASNYRSGQGSYIVLEGDEYDTAFFDKGPKFLHYHPFRAILTGVEFDHADIFKDLDHVKQAFGAFISGLSADSVLWVHDESRNANGLVQKAKCRVERYGMRSTSEWQLDGVEIDAPWTRCAIINEGRRFGTFKTRLMGEHNLQNILSAVAVADSLGLPAQTIRTGLETFQGIRRRQDIRGTKRGVTVMDDFAHHPTAVRETIRAVRPFYSDGRLIAVFEPRTNTSMRNIFQDVYPLSFDHADIVCIRKPPLLKKVTEKERFSSEKLVKDLRQGGKDAYYFPDTDKIIEFLVREAREGDLILVMSNGGFDNIHERLLESL